MTSKTLRTVAFSAMGSILVLLIAASISEKALGTEAVVRWFYTAPWTIALWLIAVVAGVAYLLRARREGRVSLPVLMLHFSFPVILAGAMTTHLFGREGALHLREGETASVYTPRSGAEECALPFSVTLHRFEVRYYAGTLTPEDYVSHISISTPEQQDAASGEVAMNRIFRYRGWRFYQSFYDADEQGATFLVSHDPAGIGITYAGYLLLLISAIAVMLPKTKTKTKTKTLTLTLTLTIMLLAVPAIVSAAPRAPQRAVADAFGNLLVEYNGRICPMSALAADVSLKLYGRQGYKAEDGTRYNANQVLCGLYFYYDDWADVPLKTSRKAMDNREREAIREMVASGALLRIWPSADGWQDVYHPAVGWEGTDEEMLFRTYALQYVAYDLTQGKNVDAHAILGKLRKYQIEQLQALPGGAAAFSESRFRAEQIFRLVPYTKPLAMAMMLLGLLFFAGYCYLRAKDRELPRALVITMRGVTMAAWLVLTLALVLRWVVSGHVPLANGHETMQALAWFGLTVGLVGGWRRADILPYSMLIAAMALMVSMMTASNPQITHLMPVLQSPLLSLHVSVIMLAYALLAFVMLNGLAALFMNELEQKRMQRFSLSLLRPAVLLLAVGIFLGAVWANISWGRYWGWDPKEVWALITMIIYAAPLHQVSLPAFRRPRFFHVYALLAFLSVLITYFGVNYFLGGMHSYA